MYIESSSPQEESAQSENEGITRSTHASTNRMEMPQCGEIVDGFRITFGPMKIPYAGEGQMEKGKQRPPEPEPPKFQLHGWSLMLYGEKNET